jgi:hypothetical protein
VVRHDERTLAIVLRPENAGSNDADHHLELLDQAIGGLPAEYQAGHDVGDHASEVIHPIRVRVDSAGATHGFVRGIVEANCDFSIGYLVDGRVRDALLLLQEEDWQPAIENDGSIRDGAWVVEFTEFVNLTPWPDALRLTCGVNGPTPEPSSLSSTPPKDSAIPAS